MKQYLIAFCIVHLFSCQLKNENTTVDNMNYENTYALKKKAEKYYQKENFLMAYNLYNELIKRDSSNGKLFYRRGFCLAKLSKFSSSTKDFLKAIELEHRLDGAYFNIACNYASIADYKLALHFFQKTLEVNPDHKYAKEEVIVLKEILGNSDL